MILLHETDPPASANVISLKRIMPMNAKNPDYIRKVQQRGSIGRKRKSAKC